MNEPKRTSDCGLVVMMSIHTACPYDGAGQVHSALSAATAAGVIRVATIVGILVES